MSMSTRAAAARAGVRYAAALQWAATAGLTTVGTSYVWTARDVDNLRRWVAGHPPRPRGRPPRAPLSA